MPLMTVGLFVLLELFCGNVLEPWLYGASTGVSSLAIIVSAVFWISLWGIVGLLLAMPLTVCLVVLGTYVPQLRFFAVLMGTAQVLSPEVKVYQRLLAADPGEAIEAAEEYLDGKTVGELYGKVLLPAVALAEQDRVRGVLDRSQQQQLAQDVLEVIEAFTIEHLPPKAGTEGSEALGTAGSPVSNADRVLCIGARNGFDEAAAGMMADLLSRRGTPATVITHEAVLPGRLTSLATENVSLFCLCYVNPAAVQHARRLIARMHDCFGGRVPIVLALWDAVSSSISEAEVLGSTRADALASSFNETPALIDQVLSVPVPIVRPLPNAA
jgi:hypothetical protein